MPVIVSRNTIKLAADASSVADYYKGYNIVVSSITNLGKKVEQTKKIIGYNGTAKIATIDGLWDNDFVPSPSDTYKIVPVYPDSRVSTNFAIMTLDYITSKRYGKGLDPFNDLELPSWLESARVCDTQSDMTIRLTNSSTPSVGAVYDYINNGIMHWQGTVKEVKTDTINNVLTYYVTFTNVLGKLTNQWNSWKKFKSGAIIYENVNLYKASHFAVYPTKPTHTSGSVSQISTDPLNTSVFLEYVTAFSVVKKSGNGPAELNMVTNANPVQSSRNGTIISGYSLYDSDGINYWRYVGWDGHDQRYVTRHQGNLIVDTSVPLFDNINNLLEHFGGILRYSAGKYSLTIEEAEGSIENSESEVRNITNDFTIGRVRLNDEGLRSSFNSLTVAYADPANKFEARNISFFNSEFLKADRNVPKKGNVSIPGVTNYYNARLLADKFLIKSRYGLTISFNMSPRGLLLNAGTVIQVQNSRYGWVDKKFRIENLTHNTDCTVDVVAKEYDDKFYVISNVSQPPSVGRAGESELSTNLNPSGLTATSIASENETYGGIEVRWNSLSSADPTIETELYGSFKSKLVITAISISTGSVINFGEPHGLEVGDEIISKVGFNGLQANKTYFVVLVPNTTSIKISTEKAGSILSLTSATELSLKFLTGSIVATLPITMNYYIDVISNSSYVEDPLALVPPTPEELVELERVRKWYWIRNKITKT